MNRLLGKLYLVFRPQYRIVCITILLTVLLLLGVAPNSVAAQTAGEFDWRAQLTCPEEHQVHDGVQYCTGSDDKGHVVHVIVIDLKSPSVRFEYVLPTGYSDGHSREQECRDPNVPAWAGPAGGCYVYDNRKLYPRMTLAQAVKRAGEVRQTPAVAAVIDADYGAPDATHGPEGLLVIRGERLDGADKCDDDFNAALRPWLGLGETSDPTTGLLPVQIDRLPSDSSPVPAWMYTGIGGGPLLVEGGEVYDGAASCEGERTLQQLDPITHCTGNPKSATPPKTEGYGSGSCRTAPHTAAGISSTRRWLFLAMSTGNDHPDVLATFMDEKLGVMDALKFDGGGSSQMWVAGETAFTIDAGGQDRPLTNFLAIYAGEGSGLILPHAAAIVDRISYVILSEGQTTSLDPTFRNEGGFTWTAEDGVVLGEKASPTSVFGKDSFHDLPRNVAPGETVSWDLPANTSGVQIHRFQLAQDGEFFGEETQFLVVVIPKALEDRREEIERQIERFIDEAKEEGEQQLEDLAKRIQEWLLQEAQKLAEDAVGTICNFAALILIVPAIGMVWERRRHRRAADENENA